MTLSDRRVWLGIMAIVALYLAALAPTVLRHLDPVTGDEPFYIMTAISLLRDRSLDETSNYANRDYDEFYPDTPLPADWQGWPAFPTTLPPHPAITEREGLFTKHGLGLSFLIAVPYEVAGRTGAMFVVLLCAVLLAGQMFLFARGAGVALWAATASALAFATTMPIAPYALLIFPEVPAALLILYATRRVLASNNSVVQFALAGCAVAFLPWLHQRFAVVSAVLGAMLLVSLVRTRNIEVLAAIVPVAIGAITIVVYNLWLYGQVTQNTEDHAGFSGLAGTLNGAGGLLLDAQWGLLVAAPLTMIAIAGIPIWVRYARRTAIASGFVVSPYLLIVAAYQVWWGEWGPPARYLVPIVPLLAAPLAAWLHQSNMWQKIAAGVAFGVTMVLTLVGFANPQRFFHHPDGFNNIYGTIGDRLNLDIATLLVPYQFYSQGPLIDRLVAPALATSLIVVLAYWRMRRYGATEPTGGTIDLSQRR